MALSLTPAHLISACLTLAAILWLGIRSGKQVKTQDDFETGGRSAGTFMVAGGIIGTLVGGASTSGTAQLAFTYGISAWWFAFGSALGCLLMALFIVKPWRKSGFVTIQQIIHLEYGPFAGAVASALASVGALLNVVSQVLAINALLAVIFGLGPVVCAVSSVVIMASYITLGGMRGASLLGAVKMLLLYLSCIVAGLLALHLSGGWQSIRAALPAEQYFNFFSRGGLTEIGMLASTSLGVLTAQVYMQAVLSGKKDGDAIRGALLCTLFIPPIGILCILVGWYMRIHFPGIDPAQALPLFVVTHMPPWFGGVVLATLLIAAVGTGSGMALGFSAIMTNDIYLRYVGSRPGCGRTLLFSRAAILAALAGGALLSALNLDSSILGWGVLAMGLRGSVLLMPMLGAMFLPGRIDARWATASSVAGFLGLMLSSAHLLPFSADPMFAGIGASALCTAAGAASKRLRG